MTKHFLRELDQLKRDVLVMGGAAEAALTGSVRAFLETDGERAEQVVHGDGEINAMELRIEEECLKILSLYGPTARDLRFVVAVFKITNDLERVGDLAVNIAERTQRTVEGEKRSGQDALRDMGERVRGMLNTALEAFLAQDAQAAQSVLGMDDQVDDLLEAIYQHEAIVVSDDGKLFKPALRELAVAKALERAADHATNIAEDVIYMATGEVVKHQH